MSRIVLVHSIQCTGCEACFSSCPTNSIAMKEDRSGFLQPKIVRKTCIRCHICEKTCPILNKELKSSGETKAYAAINKDDSIRAKSSSGGVFYELAKNIVKQGGVVFGARFDEQWEVKHDYTETLEGIVPFMGSKYVQSRIGDSYRQAKHFLEDGRWVLFSGTPCQLGGLRSFLGKEYERLIQVDLICHGVPSPKVWRSYLKDYFKGGNIQSINFREKKHGWLNSQNVIVTKNDVICENKMENPYIRGFLKNVYLRKSCYDCQFRSYHRSSDITLGDYWGVNMLCPQMFDDKGTSIVFTHSAKGEKILSDLKDKVILLKQTKDSATEHNSCMDKENPKELKRRRFFFIFGLSSFTKAEYVIDKDSLSKRLVRKIKKCF